MCPTADQHGNCAEDEQTAPPFLQRHTSRRTLHAAVALRRNRTALVMSNKRGVPNPVPQSRVMVEQRQKGGDALGSPLWPARANSGGISRSSALSGFAPDSGRWAARAGKIGRYPP